MALPYLIVGQGLAGTLLALELESRGVTVQLIDQAHAGAASKVAAGLINPITGKRIVKSWLIDELLPKAITTYGHLQKELGLSLVEPYNIVKFLHQQAEENDWHNRTSVEDLRAYVAPEETNVWLELAAKPFSMGEITQSYRINIAALIDTYQKRQLENGTLILDRFDYGDIEQDSHHIYYQQRQYAGIIFCEGAQMQHNPYFNYLPLKPSKGEALIVKYEADYPKILKNKTALIPLGSQQYWIGGTNAWEYADDKPTPDRGTEMLDEWQSILPQPIQLLQHLAAIRPATKDRAPFLGVHPKYDKLFIFNGFGTKATVLCPYFATQFADFLLERGGLLPAVDIKRFGGDPRQISL